MVQCQRGWVTPPIGASIGGYRAGCTKIGSATQAAAIELNVNDAVSCRSRQFYEGTRKPFWMMRPEVARGATSSKRLLCHLQPRPPATPAYLRSNSGRSSILGPHSEVFGRYLSRESKRLRRRDSTSLAVAYSSMRRPFSAGEVSRAAMIEPIHRAMARPSEGAAYDQPPDGRW